MKAIIAKSTLTPVFLAVAFGGCNDAQTSPGDPADRTAAAPLDREISDADRIQGQWKLVRSVRSGQQIPAEQLSGSVFRFSGDRWIPGRDENDYSNFVLDSNVSPAQIDITDRDGNKMLGIYDLDGDSLTLCLTRAGNPRPGSLASDATCNCFLIGLQR